MTTNKVNSALSNVGGRIFGIEKNDGTRISAKLINETNHYLTVADLNTKTNKKLAKSSISALTVSGQKIN